MAASTPFSLWLRGLPAPFDSRRFSNQNLDYVWHNYVESWMITIEEKRFAGETSSAQQDTHQSVAQLLKHGSGEPCATMRGWRPVEYRGHYLIRFEKTTPDDGWIEINRERCTRDDLLTLLATGRAIPRSKDARLTA